jgi:hypothetical protein
VFLNLCCNDSARFQAYGKGVGFSSEPKAVVIASLFLTQTIACKTCQETSGEGMIYTYITDLSQAALKLYLPRKPQFSFPSNHIRP